MRDGRKRPQPAKKAGRHQFNFHLTTCMYLNFAFQSPLGALGFFESSQAIGYIVMTLLGPSLDCRHPKKEHIPRKRLQSFLTCRMAEVSKLVVALANDAYEAPCKDLRAILEALSSESAAGQTLEGWADELRRTPKIVKDQYAKVPVSQHLLPCRFSRF